MIRKCCIKYLRLLLSIGIILILTGFAFCSLTFASTKEANIDYVSWGNQSNTTMLVKTTRGSVWGSGYNKNGLIDSSSTSDCLSPIKLYSGAKAIYATGTKNYLINSAQELIQLGADESSLKVLDTSVNRFITMSNGTKAKLYYYINNNDALKSGSSYTKANDVLLAARDDDSSQATTFIVDKSGKLSIDGYKTISSSETLTNVSYVDPGFSNYFATAIKNDGSLWAWSKDCNTPKKLCDNTFISKSGKDKVLAVKKDGSLWQWTATTTLDSFTSTKIMDDVKDVDMALDFQAALKDDGTLWMWGDNTYGQLGNGSYTSSNSPVKVLNSVDDIYIGPHQMAAIKSDGSLWTWGKNTNGELGLGVSGNVNSPAKVSIYEEVQDDQQYVVSSYAGDGGSISPSGDTIVNEGADQSYSINANEGYLIDRLIVDGQEIETTNSYLFRNVTSNHTIYVYFKKKENSSQDPGNDEPSGENNPKWDISNSYSINRTAYQSEYCIHISGSFDLDEYTFDVSSSNKNILETVLSKNTNCIYLYPHAAGTVQVRARDQYGNEKTCSVVVNRIKIGETDILLSDTKAYTGKNINPILSIEFNEKTLRSGSDYSLTYKNSKNVGKGTVTIIGKGDYVGNVTISFTIIPKGTSLSKIKAKKKAVVLTWKKQKRQTSGYQVRYSQKKNFASNKIIKISNNKLGKKTIKKLKKNKRYYFQIRTYKKAAGKIYYSKWSKTKTAKTK